MTYTSIVNRRRTRLVAWGALLAVFLAQLATAAYACPLIEAALAPPVLHVDTSTPCAEMAGPSDYTSALCLEHCKVGQQLVDNQPPVNPLHEAPLLAFFVSAPVADALLARAQYIEPILARATAPPVFASSSRLRI